MKFYFIKNCYVCRQRIDPTYTTWVFNGEHSSVSTQREYVEMQETYRMYKDVFVQDDDVAQLTCERRELEFTHMLEHAETSLYPGCTKYTRLSTIVVLYKHKPINGLSDKSFNELLDIIRDMLPDDNTLPDSMYSTKLLKVFDLGYEKIHVCVNDCCLFKKEQAFMETCSKCGSSRWKVNQCTNKV